MGVGELDRRLFLRGVGAAALVAALPSAALAEEATAVTIMLRWRDETDPLKLMGCFIRLPIRDIQEIAGIPLEMLGVK